MDTKIMQSLKDVLLSFGDKYYLNNILNKTKVIQDIDNHEESLVKALLDNELVKKYYSKQIGEYTIIETNKLIETFEMNDYWMDSYTKYSKKIGLTNNNQFLDESTDIVLDFPYKDTVLKAGMTKEDVDENELKPDEPFLNELIAAEEIDTLLDEKILVNAKRYTADFVKNTEEFKNNDNLILKGNNLLALHILKKRYAGKIKSIFIDPPYYFIDKKPSDTFSYNSNFKKSSWLTFMYNRLVVAKELMNEYGIIFITISDQGAHYLKVMIDSIFKEENFIADVTWESRKSVSSDGLFSPNSNHLLVYAKDIDNIDKNDFRLALDIETFKYEDEKGKYRVEPFDAPGIRPNLTYEIKNPNTGEVYLPPNGRCWRTTPEGYQQYLKDGYIQFGVSGKSKPQLKAYYHEVAESGKGKASSTIWHDIRSSIGWYETDTNTSATKHQRNLFGESIFTNPKPEDLIKRVLELSTSKGDIVLDFFMGSATTQAVAMKMNRQFIGIEQMDYINTVSVPRLQKVIEGEQGGISKDVDWQGGGSFVYAELMEKSRGYIDSVMNADDSEGLNKIYQIMLDNVSLDFRTDLEAVRDMLNETIGLDDKKRLLIKVIDKNQLYYNYSEIEDETVRDLISDSDYSFNKSFYEGDNDGEEN